MSMFLTLRLADESATAQLAGKMARQLRAGDVLFLSGDLGTGKTTFTRHLIRAFGLDTKVKSPTYTLLETYDLPTDAPAQTLHHFDLYRLADPREWYSAGFDELLTEHSIGVVEWAEKAEGALPKPDWRIHLTHDDPVDIGDNPPDDEILSAARFAVIEAVSAPAAKRIGALRK